MWNKIQELMGQHHPERLRVARLCIENGLAVRDDGIYLNRIEIPTARIARAAGVDRRTVAETVRMIQSDTGLRDIFERLQSAGPSLKGVAKKWSFGVVEKSGRAPRSIAKLARPAKLLRDPAITIRP